MRRLKKLLVEHFGIRRAARIMQRLGMPGRIGLRITPEFRLLVRIHHFVLVMGKDAVDISDEAFEVTFSDVDPQFLANIVGQVRMLGRVYGD